VEEKENLCDTCRKMPECFEKGIFERYTCDEYEPMPLPELAEREQFVREIMVGNCPRCGSDHTFDCEHSPAAEEVRDITIGHCLDCDTYWCLGCGYIFEKVEKERECPHWEICARCSKEKGYLDPIEFVEQICARCENYDNGCQLEDPLECEKRAQFCCPYEIDVSECPKIRKMLWSREAVRQENHARAAGSHRKCLIERVTQALLQVCRDRPELAPLAQQETEDLRKASPFIKSLAVTRFLHPELVEVLDHSEEPLQGDPNLPNPAAHMRLHEAVLENCMGNEEAAAALNHLTSVARLYNEEFLDALHVALHVLMTIQGQQIWGAFTAAQGKTKKRRKKGEAALKEANAWFARAAKGNSWGLPEFLQATLCGPPTHPSW